MSEFKPRFVAPEESNKYYYSDNVFYTSGYGLPNCTCYAWGRWYEILGEKPKLSINNAIDWYYYNDGYERGDKPNLGDIACFSSDNGLGHLAVVENVENDGSITVSNSDYGGRLFYILKLNNTYNLGSGYKFLGFIKMPLKFRGNDEQENKDYVDYTIQYGDTLSQIAEKYNTTYQELAKINNISNPNVIIVGNTIKVPKNEIDYIEYVVKKNDTLSEIAEKYNTTYQHLAQINNIEDPNLIYVGQIIKIY